MTEKDGVSLKGKQVETLGYDRQPLQTSPLRESPLPLRSAWQRGKLDTHLFGHISTPRMTRLIRSWPSAQLWPAWFKMISTASTTLQVLPRSTCSESTRSERLVFICQLSCLLRIFKCWRGRLKGKYYWTTAMSNISKAPGLIKTCFNCYLYYVKGSAVSVGSARKHKYKVVLNARSNAEEWPPALCACQLLIEIFW